MKRIVQTRSDFVFPAKAIALLFGVSFLLIGCSGGGKTETAVSFEYTTAETAAASYNGNIDAGYSMDYGEYEEYGYDMAEASAMEASAVPANSANSSLAAISQRKLIRNVHMQVETDAFDDLLKQLQSEVSQLSGYLESSDISGFSMNYDNTRQNRSAYMTARIPSDKLDQFIVVIEGSSNVTSKSESTQDVTLQYNDLESRKKTLSVEQDRIWALLEKADTLEAVIALEERLSEIRYELESMESQLKLFDNQVEYSTIDISIQEVTPAAFTPTAPETVGQRIQKGFSKNINNISNTMLSLFILLAAGSPIWIPIAVIVFSIVFVIRKKRKPCRKIQEKTDISHSSFPEESAAKDES